MKPHLREESRELWAVVASPATWAVHFLLSYGTAAVYCAKLAGPGGALSSARTAIFVYTIVALAVVIAIGVRGYQHHRYGGAQAPHDDDSPEDRHRFLGFATLLLSGLSAIGVVYAALPAIFIGSCR